MTNPQHPPAAQAEPAQATAEVDRVRAALERFCNATACLPMPGQPVTTTVFQTLGMALSEARSVLDALPNVQPKGAPADLYERLAEAHDASLDDDHRACRSILTECMRLLTTQATHPAAQARPVVRAHVRSVTPGRIDEFDVLRPLPVGEHLLYAAPAPAAQAEPDPAEGDARTDFEAWTVSFYGGLANAADSWDEQRQTYTDYAHHMAWCLWRSLAPRANVQPKGTPAAQAEPAWKRESRKAAEGQLAYYRDMMGQARAALAQPAELPPLPEPNPGPGAAWRMFTADQMHAYARAALAQRARVALTDEQIDAIWKSFLQSGTGGYIDFARAIERAHGITGEVKP